MIALGYSGGKEPKNAIYHWTLAIGGIVQDGILLALVLAIAGFSMRLLALRRPSWRTAIPRMALILVGIYIFEGIYAGVVHLHNEQGITPSHWQPAHAAAYIANAAVICTWVPFVEELTFRGVGVSLLRRFGNWPAIVVVGILFGLAHGLLVSLPILVVFGCALAWLRIRTDSVVPGMIVHGLFNLIALVAAVTVGGYIRV